LAARPTDADVISQSAGLLRCWRAKRSRQHELPASHLPTREQYLCHSIRIFPAWKKNFTDKQLDEVGDQFEDIEHKMFGKDGFDDAEKRISSIEAALGFADLSQFTPPPPPKP
jgi:hypothetical protein